MPLLDPLNDEGCLRKLHQSVSEYMQTEQARALAAQFSTVDEVIEFIRHLEQRDDLGDPRDGPRLACDVTQRLRLPALDPNCFERLALFLALALLIDPSLELTSATMMLDEGLHSFPLMLDGGIPHVIDLSPQLMIPHNAMNATAYQLRNASPLAESALAPWFADLAWNACTQHGAEECYHVAMQAIRESLLTGRPLRNASAIDCVLGLAYDDAQLFGAKGRTAFDRVEKSLRNLSLKLDTKRVAGFVNDLLSEPMAGELMKAALVAQFGPAAAIALQGVNLGTAQAQNGRTQAAAETQAATTSATATNTDNAINSALALVRAADTPNQERSNQKRPLTREEKRQRLRRLSLAFREPTVQEK